MGYNGRRRFQTIHNDLGSIFGKLGFASCELERVSTVHPLKRNKLQRYEANSTSKKSTDQCSVCGSSSSNSDFECEDYDVDAYPLKRSHNTSKYAVNLVSKAGVSTSKAAQICTQLSSDAIQVPTPSQPAIYKSTMKQAAAIKDKFAENLHKEK